MGILDRWFGSEITPAAPLAALDAVAVQGKPGVFLSYNHKDRIIASALEESLASLTDLNVFIDHAGLEGGDDYEAKISEAIRASHWFVMICSGAAKAEKDMSWCYYEAGQFRAKLEAADQAKAIRDRLCYLYDGERPSQLARYQGYLISTIDRSGKFLNVNVESDDSIGYESTELFNFLELILTKSRSGPLRNINDANVRKLMRSGVRKITCSFEQNRIDEVIGEEVFQPRISFRIPPPSQEVNGLTPETAIVGEYRALQDIFSIAGAEATWADVKAKSSRNAGNGMIPLWINDLEAAATDVARGDVPRQTDFLCFGSDEKYYRPIIARYEKFRSSAKKCYVAFIPARDRRFNLSFKTSLLLSALILSVRFRQRVLPLVEDLRKIEPAPDSRKVELLQKIQNEIVMVEAEAMEFGLSPPKHEHDEPPLLDSFRDGPDKEYLRAEIIKWSVTRAAIFDTIGEARDPKKSTSWSAAAASVISGFENLSRLNGTFIDLLCRELLYAEKIEGVGSAGRRPDAGLPPLSRAAG